MNENFRPDKQQHALSNKPNLELSTNDGGLYFKDKHEPLIECSVKCPTLQQIFSMAHNPTTAEYGAVIVSTSNLPDALKQILNFAGALYYVQRHVEEIIFCPNLKYKQVNIPNLDTSSPLNVSVGAR